MVVLGLLSYGYMFIFLILDWKTILLLPYYFLCIDATHALIFGEFGAFLRGFFKDLRSRVDNI